MSQWYFTKDVSKQPITAARTVPGWVKSDRHRIPYYLSESRLDRTGTNTLTKTIITNYGRLSIADGRVSYCVAKDDIFVHTDAPNYNNVWNDVCSILPLWGGNYVKRMEREKIRQFFSLLFQKRTNSRENCYW